MNKITTGGLAAAMLLATAVHASVVWNGETFPENDTEADALGYVRLLTADPTSPRSSSYVTGVRWSDGNCPHEGTKYFVSKSYIISPDAGAGTYVTNGVTRTNRIFYGDRIVLAGNAQFGPCGGGNSPTAPITTGTEGLFSVNAKGIINWSGNKACIQGPFTIINGASAPFQVLSQPLITAIAVQPVYFFGDWRSIDTSTVIFTRTPSTSSAFSAVRFNLSGSMDEFLGTMVTETNCTIIASSGLPNGTLRLGLNGYTGMGTTGLAPVESGLNGEFQSAAAYNAALSFGKIYSNGGTLTLNATNRWVAGELVLNAGIVNVDLGNDTSNARLSATGSMEFETKPVKLRIADRSSLPATAPQAWTVVSAPSGSFEIGDFDVSCGSLECSVVDDGETARLVVTRLGTVETINEVSYKDSSAAYPTHFDSSTNIAGTVLWSDGLAPTNPAVDYIIKHKAALPCGPNALDPFGGHSLTLKGINLFSGNNTPGACGMNVPDLRIDGWAKMSIWSGSNRAGEMRFNKTTYRIRGGLTIPSAAVFTLNPYGGKFLRVESTVSGSGTLKLSTIDSTATTSAYAYHELTAANTGFTGQVLLTHPGLTNASVPEAPTETLNTTLYVSDGRSLGGPLASFRHDAIRIEKMSVLKVDASSVALDQANRGVSVGGCARLDVPAGCALAISTPLTLRGHLRKEGDGVLALGGALRFGENDAAGDFGTPSAETNVIRVLAGSLKPTATNALDGAALRFADGAKLVFDAAPAGDGMAEYGPVNVKWATPLAFESGATSVRVPVEIEKGAYGDNPPNTVSVALGTFPSAAAAEGVAGMLDCRSPWKRLRPSVSVRGNADGTATVVCALEHAGLLLIVK